MVTLHDITLTIQSFWVCVTLPFASGYNNTQKTDELQAALQREMDARTQLESQLQQFTDRLSPLVVSPAP